MKSYVITTGTIFGLITLAHLVRVLFEPQQATDPFFILLTLTTVLLCTWAWRLIRYSARVERLM